MSRGQKNLPPVTDIEIDHSLKATTEKWFEYAIKVHPHHTDYAGIVWHGNYIHWMEEARIEYLNSIGIDYVDLVKAGCELPVVELNLRYHQSLHMGDSALVRVKMGETKGVKIYWDYEFINLLSDQLSITGRVTLVAIDTQKGKIMRSLPPLLQNALIKLNSNPQ